MKTGSFLGAAVVACALTAVALGTEARPRGDGERRGPPPEVRAAFDSCATENGITINRAEGQRPTKDQRKIIHACMKKKGFDHPPHRRGGGRGHGDEHRPPPPEADEAGRNAPAAPQASPPAEPSNHE